MQEKRVSIIKKIILILSIGFGVFQIATAIYMPLPALSQRSVHLGFALPLIFLYQALDAKHVVLRIVYYVLAALGVVVNVYLEQNWIALSSAQYIPMAAYVLGIITIILVLIAAWRTVGFWMPLISCGFLAYCIWGSNLTGMFRFPAISLRRFVSTMYWSFDGIFGTCLGASASFVFMFIFFGEVLVRLGGGEFMINFAQSIIGTVRGGPAKIAVISSCLMGMVSGSAVANVAGTGVITIPMMKKIGYQPHFAGAVETAASTGGQLMPPVMGVAAFVMAEMLGMPYGKVCLAALIPAVLYYVSVFVCVDLRAAKNGLKGASREELPKFKETFKAGWHYLISLVVLVVLLIVLQWSASKAALWATITLVVSDTIRRIINKNLLSAHEYIDIFVTAGKNIIPVAAATACAGIIIGAFTATGLNLRLSSILVALSGDHLFVLLILAMIGGIILGMGMPTTPVYIIMSVLIAPALIDMGVLPISAHMFVLYFGVMASLTPPVGMAFYVAAGIAKAPAMKTGFTAWRLALPGFLLPFVFAYQPALLMQGEALQIVITTTTAFLGVLAMSCGMEGYIFRSVNKFIRCCLILSSLLLIVPETYTDLVGLAIFVACIGLEFVHRNGQKPIPAKA